MKAIAAALATSAGYKALVAVSGLLLCAWCALHILGNGAAFAGPGALDGYAAWLRRGAGVPLWGMRLLLLAVAAAHVGLASSLWLRARAARREGYRVVRYAVPGFAARFMRACGVALGLFIVLHVLHINYGVFLPGFVRGQVYANLAQAFGSPVWLGVYLLGSLLLGVHLAHGLCAALSSLGWLAPSPNTRRVSTGLATLCVLGFSATPVAMALGVLQ
jgi:succinate dehydrogenase / fumarate reductase, cytochrome b subunit